MRTLVDNPVTGLDFSVLHGRNEAALAHGRADVGLLEALTLRISVQASRLRLRASLIPVTFAEVWLDLRELRRLHYWLDLDCDLWLVLVAASFAFAAACGTLNIHFRVADFSRPFPEFDAALALDAELDCERVFRHLRRQIFLLLVRWQSFFGAVAIRRDGVRARQVFGFLMRYVGLVR